MVVFEVRGRIWLVEIWALLALQKMRQIVDQKPEFDFNNLYMEVWRMVAYNG